jgi:hypothetical protein
MSSEYCALPQLSFATSLSHCAWVPLGSLSSVRAARGASPEKTLVKPSVADVTEAQSSTWRTEMPG